MPGVRRSRDGAMSIWGSVKHAFHHAAHKAAKAAKKAGEVVGGVVGDPVGAVVDGAENKGIGQDDDASADKGHDA